MVSLIVNFIGAGRITSADIFLLDVYKTFFAISKRKPNVFLPYKSK